MSSMTKTDNRLDQLFSNSEGNLLNIYCSAGYPELESTRKIIQILDKAGVDIIELGIPYSDPLADGPVIQASGQKALGNGISLKLIFEQVETARQHSQIPIILMGYLNCVMQFGVETFCKRCQDVGVDAVILPDMPIDVYLQEYQVHFDEYGIGVVFLITPNTSAERIQLIDNLGPSFIYAVSSSSTTGTKNTLDGTEEYLERIQGMELKSPIMTGFNIKDKKSFDTACSYTDGAIIGSAFIRALDPENLESSINQFVKSIR
jgi:tryptophan synthase alpha chain